MNARRWLYYILSILTLAAGLWGLNVQRRLSALPDDVPLERIEFPATIDGTSAGSASELELLAQRRAPGSVSRVESGDRTFEVTLRPAIGFLLLAITAVCGLFFWVVAVVVFASRLDLVEAHILFFATLFYGLAILIGGVYFPAPESRFEVLLPILRISAIAMLPTIFVSLTLVFPQRRDFIIGRPFVIPGIYALGGVVAVWHVLAFLRYVAGPGPSAWAALEPASRGADLFLIGGEAVGCFLLYRGSRRLVLARERRQTKWLLWGITFGVTPYAFLHVLPQHLGPGPLIPLELARLATLAIPIAFAFAVARYQFLDIDIIIRRSVIYALLAGVMVGIYFLLAVLAGREIRRMFPEHAGLIPVLSAVVPVALFGPTRRVIGKWVDRTLFKIQYGYGRALRRMSVALPRAASQEEVSDLLERFLVENLDPKSVDVIVSAESEHWEEGVFTASTRLEDTPDSDSRSGGAALVVAAPGSTSMPEVERADFSPRLLAVGYRLLVPLQAGRSVAGLILLGEKRTERRYLEQDIELLGRLAQEAATALDRIGLVRQMVEVATERQRLDQLNRLKSDFLFRVAHDLRTPLTSIAWSTRNLLDGIAGSLGEKQTGYLKSIDASSRQLGRLVNNLLEISRLELGSERIEPAPTDLGSTVEEAVAGLEPIADAREVTIDLRLNPDLPRARCHRGKLIEVVTNLIENAVKFAPPRTAIDVAVEREGVSHQRVTVRDRGPGIAAEDRERIFERFHQGAPSPFSQQGGFGLGLYVVKSYVDLMGGTVTAENHTEGGAVFACSFPDWQREEA